MSSSEQRFWWDSALENTHEIKVQLNIIQRKRMLNLLKYENWCLYHYKHGLTQNYWFINKSNLDCRILSPFSYCSWGSQGKKVKEQYLKVDMEKQTGSKLGQEYIKAV